MNKLYLYVLAFLACVSVGAAVLVHTYLPKQPIACTQEAKLCPDGSAVGRVGPSCEFAACPATPPEDATDTVPSVGTSTASSTPNIPKAGSFTTTIGKSVSAQGVKITPKKILEDSRCPSGVQCIWAGTVRVEAAVSDASGEATQTFVLNEPLLLAGEKVTLTEVAPYPASGKKIDPGTYSLTFTFEAGEEMITAYTTAYTYWDNTPPGSADISNPVLHQKAGGTGTYADPITIAVGHSIENGKDILDYPAGTRFYIPNVRRYFIVEDTCGDGDTPQNGPCHSGYPKGTTAWVDIWIDGASGSGSTADACAQTVTDTNGEAHLIIRNPVQNYAVVSGPIIQHGTCTKLFGDVRAYQ